MATITLRDIKTGDDWHILRAHLEDKKLEIAGHDLGPKVEAFWGDSDYEYWYDFDQENTRKLFEKILSGIDNLRVLSEDQLLTRFKDWMEDPNPEKKLRTFCTEAGVQYKFSSY